MTEYVYRVVQQNGQPFENGIGRGSDPFTRLASAKARATKENGRVQRSAVNWEDLDGD
mgnify:CR=1 FL=1